MADVLNNIGDEDEFQTRLDAHDADALGCSCWLCNDENGPRPREGDGSLLRLEHLSIVTRRIVEDPRTRIPFNDLLVSDGKNYEWWDEAKARAVLSVSQIHESILGRHPRMSSRDHPRHPRLHPPRRR